MTNRLLTYFFSLEFLLSTWWVAAVVLFSIVLYERGSFNLQNEIKSLSQQLHEIEHRIESESERQKILTLEVNSQSDPAWIEQVLIEKLGLIPQGYTKVYVEYTKPHEPKK